jgi:hypothetical protein
MVFSEKLYIVKHSLVEVMEDQEFVRVIAHKETHTLWEPMREAKVSIYSAKHVASEDGGDNDDDMIGDP